MDYDDGLVACADDALVIRRYSWRLSPRRIPYGDIRFASWIALNSLQRWRLWGSSDFRHWLNLDGRRPRKHVGLALDVGRGMKPVITPDDPAAVADVLRRHGVEVRGSDPVGV